MATGAASPSRLRFFGYICSSDVLSSPSEAESGTVRSLRTQRGGFGSEDGGFVPGLECFI